MISERQWSEGPPEVNGMPLRPSDDDTNGVHASHSFYLLGEVSFALDCSFVCYYFYGMDAVIT